MLDPKVRAKYKVSIGIECHVQLKTKSKLFSGSDNDARSAAPNTLVNHIDFGLPGALPVLNREAVRLASKMGFALNSRPQQFSKFDRKHYFYPDLPMGYQITQYDQPIIVGGSVDIEVDGKRKTIGITRAHLEADAGKSIHPAGKDYSLVDLNRAGTPLLEVVSEPDMHSPQDAKAYVRELYLLAKYSGASDANLYYGNMRFDVNVSVSTSDALGTRTETKNLNSFRSVEKAAEYEISRQIELLEKGERIVQETRGWDEAKQKTLSQRGKEEANDYRYMPDPDLPPLILDDEYVAKIESAMPMMPGEWRRRLESLGLSKDAIETLIDAEVEEGQVAYLSLIERLLKTPQAARQIANWQINVEVPLRRENKLEGNLKDEDRLNIYQTAYELFTSGKMNSNQTKDFLMLMMNQNSVPADIEAFATDKGLVQESDEGEIGKIVEEVLAEHAKVANDVKNGEIKAIGFLVGAVMKKSQGKANPQLAQKLIKIQLGL
jgi:aspartyl-tRNA(Asn)/glutamyl-tRNA(Gln) amidotransferase subunit B